MTMLLRKQVLILIFFVFLSACGSSNTDDDSEASGDTFTLDCSLSSTYLAPSGTSWTYWLQDINLVPLGESAFDVVVIDYSSDGSSDNEFSAAQIAALKNSSGGSKTVLAYMSIGEAEVDRFYWEASWIDGSGAVTGNAPSWMAESNPDFPDNYKVRYWEEAWQNIIFGTTSGSNKSYLDRIIDAGFDGVYLDIIDAFEYFGPGGEQEERSSAGEDMISFVLGIANYARTTRGVSNFLVFPQNGANILTESSACNYLEAINGIGAEDTFYYGGEDNNNDLDLTHAAATTPYLDVIRENGKMILSIDYVQEASKVDDFYSRAQDRNYIPYASVRDLNVLTTNAGHEPD